jgi:hypothetical protein
MRTQGIGGLSALSSRTCSLSGDMGATRCWKIFCFVQPLLHRDSSSIGITDAQKAPGELRERRVVLGASPSCGTMLVGK